jgi:hypothetical protein
MKSIYIIFIIFITFSCDKKWDTVITKSNGLVLDSFTVNQLASSIEIKNFKLYNSKLLSLTPENNSIRIYKLNGDKNYVLEKNISLSNTYLPHSFFRYKDCWYVIDFDGNLIKYDSNWSFIKKTKLYFNLNVLKDNNIVAVYNNLPVEVFNDTIVAHIYHKDYSGQADYFFEKPYIKFKIENDSVRLLEQFGEKPSSTKNYYLSYAYHCFKKHSIYTIYPCFDTIYKSDITNTATKKFAINNPAYSLPKTFLEDSLMNNEYVTKYLNNNFLYTESIVYNPKTDHFAVFYYTNSQPNTQKEQLNAVILDKDFKKVCLVNFDQKYYDPQSSFYVPNKGIALGVMKNAFDFETTKFHIFNF